MLDIWIWSSLSSDLQQVGGFLIKFVSDLQLVGGFLQFPSPIKLTARYNWNIVESGGKHHKHTPLPPNPMIVTTFL
jgi:hypothetical protein